MARRQPAASAAAERPLAAPLPDASAMDERRALGLHALSALLFAGVWRFYLGMLQGLFRRPEVIRHLTGWGVEFFTVWAQALVQFYVFTTFARDVLEQIPGKDPWWKDHLDNIRHKIFPTIVVPSAALVCVKFWVLYWVDAGLLESFGVLQTVVSPAANHGLHSAPLLVVLLEAAACPRPFPTARAAAKHISTMLGAYTVPVVACWAWSGVWPYPFMEVAARRWETMVALLAAAWLIAYGGFCVASALNTAALDKIKASKEPVEHSDHQKMQEPTRMNQVVQRQFADRDVVSDSFCDTKSLSRSSMSS